MKKLKKLLIVIVLLILACQAQAGIYDVNIVPEVPTINDPITIVAYGYETVGGVPIDHVNFTKNGTSLQLDIFVRFGNLPSGTFWSHSETIGTLPEEVYDLQINAYGWHAINQEYVLFSTYPTTFEVIPEPATLLLLGFGFLQIHRNRIRKRIV